MDTSCKITIIERKISPKLIENVLTRHSKGSLETQECEDRDPQLKIVQQKISGKKIICVVINKRASPWKVVTAYTTSKTKYWKNDDN